MIDRKRRPRGLPLVTKAIYAAPAFATTPVLLLVTLFMNDFYEGLGLTLSQLFFFTAVSRTLDVVIYPCMAYITDSTRNFLGQNMGRRRPFILSGAPFYAMLLVFLMAPPDVAAGKIRLYYGISYILFSLISTYTLLPYDSLAAELSPSPEDRDVLFALTAVAEALGSILAVAVPIGMGSYM